MSLTDNFPPARIMPAVTPGPLMALGLLLGLTFLLGGGARGDIQSLMVLRPVSILLLGYGLSRLSREQLRAHSFLFAMAAAIVALVVVQLVPLPPSIWSRLGGRGIVVEVGQVASLGPVWRPLSLVPAGTWNALWSLAGPLAVLVLAVQLTDEERRNLPWLVLVSGLISAGIALLQILGDSHGSLYFYRTTNYGGAVGLFANRNHQAVFMAMLLPVLAVCQPRPTRRHRSAQRSRTRGIAPLLPIACAAFLLLLILITGSRAGVIVAAFALLSIPLLRPSSGQSASHRLLSRIPVAGRVALVIAMPLLFVGLAVWLGRAEAIERLFHANPVDDARLAIVPTLISMVATYFPWGSGFGSFIPVFQIHEPTALLTPAYWNHAHDDWLELAITGGIPAILLLGIAIAAFMTRAVQILLAGATQRTADIHARLGMVIIFLFALASLSDYPLRVPSLACLFTLATFWAAGHGRPYPAHAGSQP